MEDCSGPEDGPVDELSDECVTVLPEDFLLLATFYHMGAILKLGEVLKSEIDRVMDQFCPLCPCYNPGAIGFRMANWYLYDLTCHSISLLCRLQISRLVA